MIAWLNDWMVGWSDFSRQVGIRRDSLNDCSDIFRLDIEIKVKVKIEVKIGTRY